MNIRERVLQNGDGKSEIFQKKREARLAHGLPLYGTFQKTAQRKAGQKKLFAKDVSPAVI